MESLLLQDYVAQAQECHVADGEAEAEWCEEIAACLCRIADGAENAFNDLLHLVIKKSILCQDRLGTNKT
jgi:hypothetical protein